MVFMIYNKLFDRDSMIYIKSHMVSIRARHREQQSSRDRQQHEVTMWQPAQAVCQI